MEDTTSGLNMRVATVTINDGRDRTHENVLFSYSMNRRDFNSGNTYQNFEGQFRATTGGAYEWRTWFTNAAYIRIHYVTVRSLDPTSTDTTPPTTLMTALPTASPSPVTVSWSGSDSGTGIWYFEIQVADNTLGTGWQPWIPATSSLSGIYTNGIPCHAYQFRVRAVDNAGNPQDWANAAQASTTISCGLTMSAAPSIVPADGVSSSTISIQTQDNVQGRVISLSTNLGTLSASSCTTGSGGSCTATINSNTSGVATITATSSSYVTGTTMVSFSYFTISAVASTGQFGGETITVGASNGFTGTITLTDTFPPALTCSSITPSTITLTTSTTSGTASLSCTGPPGYYTVTITGTSTTGPSSSITRSYPISITMDYSITPSPTALGIPFGSTGSSTISVSSIAGFTGTVSLGLTITPPGLSCFLTNVSPSPSSANPTVTSLLSCHGYGGDYLVSISSNNGSASHTAYVIVGVSDFSITTAPVPPLTPGASWNSSITLTPVGGFTGTVNLIPTSSNFSITANNNPGTVSLFPGGAGLYDASQWVAGSSSCCSFPIVLGSTGNGYIYAATFALLGGTVYLNRPAPPGLSSNVVRTITIHHLISYVQISMQFPTSFFTFGVFWEYFYFSYGSSLMGTTSTTTQPGSYLVTTTATSSMVTHTSTVLVNIPDFKITAGQTSISTVVSATASSTITLTPIGGFTGTVNLALSTSPPAGILCWLSTTSITASGTSVLNCSGTAVGAYNVTVTGTSGSMTHFASVTYNVRDFSITVTPMAVTIPDGRSATLTVQATSVNGYSGTVSLGWTSVYCATSSFGKSALQIPSGGLDSTSLTVTMGPNCLANQYGTSVTGYDSSFGIVRYANLNVNSSDFFISTQNLLTFGIAGTTTLNYNVTYYNNNNYPGSILTQTSSFGANNCCLSTSVPTIFSITKPDGNSAPGLITNINVQKQSFFYPWNGQG
ncbi:hypothetical protein E6H36_13210, partial [Candidatus Bathyarchaeota archaeon]